jgi:hypothetical protein
MTIEARREKGLRSCWKPWTPCPMMVKWIEGRRFLAALFATHRFVALEPAMSRVTSYWVWGELAVTMGCRGAI